MEGRGGGPSSELFIRQDSHAHARLFPISLIDLVKYNIIYLKHELMFASLGFFRSSHIVDSLLFVDTRIRQEVWIDWGGRMTFTDRRGAFVLQGRISYLKKKNIYLVLN